MSGNLSFAALYMQVTFNVAIEYKLVAKYIGVLLYFRFRANSNVIPEQHGISSYRGVAVYGIPESPETLVDASEHLNLRAKCVQVSRNGIRIGMDYFLAEGEEITLDITLHFYFIAGNKQIVVYRISDLPPTDSLLDELEGRL